MCSYRQADAGVWGLPSNRHLPHILSLRLFSCPKASPIIKMLPILRSSTLNTTSSIKPLLISTHPRLNYIFFLCSPLCSSFFLILYCFYVCKLTREKDINPGESLWIIPFCSCSLSFCQPARICSSCNNTVWTYLSFLKKRLSLHFKSDLNANKLAEIVSSRIRN